MRSSANAEDLPGASFAGQYSSFLNVRGEAELLKAVRECWASLWNERAVSYRRKHGIGNRDLAHGVLAHGVLVQRLIPAEMSGILFTANPVNGRRDQLLLNASWGLGEAIVGGFEIVFYVSASSTYIKRARKILAACGGDPSDLEPVEKAVPHSVTTEMGMAILEVARALDARAAKATADAPEVCGSCPSSISVMP